jgi:amino acid transporter
MFFFIVIGVLAGCTDDKHKAKYVFLQFENHTGWPSDGVAWCVGLLPALYAFFSLDAATHYCEEIENANVAVPRASKLSFDADGNHVINELQCYYKAF